MNDQAREAILEWIDTQDREIHKTPVFTDAEQARKDAVLEVLSDLEELLDTL